MTGTQLFGLDVVKFYPIVILIFREVNLIVSKNAILHLSCPLFKNIWHGIVVVNFTKDVEKFYLS